MSAPAEWIAVVDGKRPELQRGIEVYARMNEGNGFYLSHKHAVDWFNWNAWEWYRLAAQPEAKQSTSEYWQCDQCGILNKESRVLCRACPLGVAPAGGEAQQKINAAPQEQHPGQSTRPAVEAASPAGAAPQYLGHCVQHSLFIPVGEKCHFCKDGKRYMPAEALPRAKAQRQNLPEWLALRGRQAWPETVRPVLEGFPINGFKEWK